MVDQLDNDDYKDDIEAFEEDVEDDYEESSFRRWGVLAGIGVAVVCIGLIVVLWFGRDVFMAPIAAYLASATPTPTNTLPPTATFTQFPTATETLLPSETATAAPARQPAPEVMAVAIPPPALQENFADNSRAWTTMGETSEFLIQENRLILESNQPGQPGAVYCAGNCGPFKDAYYYEAEMLDERGSEFGYGLTFAINDQRNTYYAYKVRPGAGEYGLFKLVNGSWTPLIDWTKNTAVLPPPQTNVLGASLQGQNITLFINGARLNIYDDKSPLNEGRIGFMVDQDGARLFAGNLMVYQLAQTTPAPPGQALTPGAPGQPTPAAPTPQTRFTSTPTPAGSCPRDTPANTWILVITNVDQSKKEITINGVTTKIDGLIASFYLTLNTDYLIEIGNKKYEYNLPACKVVYLKAK